MSSRKIVGIGTAVVVLFVFGVSQLQAQSGLTLEDLSSRITALTRRVSTLSNTTASKNEVVALENRLATVEAQLGLKSPASTATRPRSTSTPATTALSVTVKKSLSIRRGPSPVFEFVGLVVADDKLTVTGRNAVGDWWKVVHEGQDGWVYAPNFSSDLVKVVPTPIWPTITPQPAATLRPTRTPTRIRPTSTRRPTATRRPTRTPTAVNAYITITRNMNVRRGPGTNYVVLGYATIGEEFDINGKNADGSWWRISLDGRNGWIFAPFVTAFNAGNVPVVPALAPLPTNTPGPQPTQTQYSSIEYAAILMGMDWNRNDLQRRWSSFSEDQKSVMLLATATYLELTAEYCNMSLQEAGRMINRHGQYLDDTGYTIRNDIRARSFLMLVLTEAEEAARTPYGCDNWLRQATGRLLTSED